VQVRQKRGTACLDAICNSSDLHDPVEDELANEQAGLEHGGPRTSLSLLQPHPFCVVPSVSEPRGVQQEWGWTQDYRGRAAMALVQ
jgi:hypothetical protein